MASLSWLDAHVEGYLRRVGRQSLPSHCPACAIGDQLMRWGRYWRRLRTAEREYRVPIARVRCRACGRAPGLLPSFVLARRLYARPLIERARLERRAGRSFARIALGLSSEFLLAPNLVLAWVRTRAPAQGP